MLNRRLIQTEQVPLDSFSRSSVAYLNGSEYSADIRRLKDFTIPSITDGAIPAGAGIGGEHIKVMCKNSTYLFGVGMGTYKLYRSTDGINFSQTGYATTMNGSLFSLTNGNLVFFNNDNYKCFYSSDNGESFTEGSYDTPRKTASSVITWGMAQHGNTLLVCEYGPASDLGGQYMYRSTNGGATWTMVVNLADQTPAPYHWHTVAYHEATGYWVAFFGDTQPKRGAMKSIDDGVTWENLHIAGNYMDQPIACLDTGDATRLLCGFDGGTSIGWVNVSTGEIEGIEIFEDPRTTRMYTFSLGYYDGVYYRGGFTTAATLMAPSLMVSTDLINWSVYHKITIAEGIYGFHQFIGYFGNKLHWLMQTTGTYTFRHFAISPCDTSIVTGTLIEPPVTNLANSENLSSFETSNTWTVTSLNWQVEKYASAYNGSYGLRMWGNDSDTRTTSCASPNIVLGDSQYETKYVIQLRAKASNPLGMTLRLYRNFGTTGYVDDTSLSVFVLDKNWKYIRSHPFTIAAGDVGNFRAYTIFSQGPVAGEVFIDSFQISPIPITEWQIGGTPKTSDILTRTVTTPSEFTDIFCVQTLGLDVHYKSRTNQYLKTWKVDNDNYLSLYYNPIDFNFYLDANWGDPSVIPVSTGIQYFSPHQIIKFALKFDSTGISLVMQNGRELILDDGSNAILVDSYAGLFNNSITMIYGDINSSNQFPGIYFDDTMDINTHTEDSTGMGFIPFSITDGDIENIFNLSPTFFIDTRRFIASDKELFLGGMPLSLSEYTEQITETIHTYPHINNKITVYAINIIKKYTIHPIVSTEFSTVWNGTRLALTQDSDGRLYINMKESLETSSPRNRITIQGMPISLGEHSEIMFKDSGYTTHNVEKWSYLSIGGMPITIGQIGEKWYLVVYSF